ncbi:PA14 domain-containing protein [Alkalilimnicola ehrlichii]|nr:PA14 domain-containing protein [Alkalilimnicola ehrlichii]
MEKALKQRRPQGRVGGVRWVLRIGATMLLLGTGLASAASVMQEIWDDVPGPQLESLLGHPDFPHRPDRLQPLSRFEISANSGNHYGSRVRAYLKPPRSGWYTFWLASDDQGELWLSTDERPENKVRIASVPGWTMPRQWDKYAEQKSAGVWLAGGRRYYIEALHKEGIGDDHLAVAWAGPDKARQVIGGANLSPLAVHRQQDVLVGGGLTADYYGEPGLRHWLLTRVDPKIDLPGVAGRRQLI